MVAGTGHLKQITALLRFLRAQQTYIFNGVCDMHISTQIFQHCLFLAGLACMFFSYTAPHFLQLPLYMCQLRCTYAQCAGCKVGLHIASTLFLNHIIEQHRQELARECVSHLQNTFEKNGYRLCMFSRLFSLQLHCSFCYTLFQANQSRQ